MNKYIFYQTGVIMLYISSQQSNFILFLTPISAFDTLMIVGEFAKQQFSKRHFLLQPYTSLYE